MRQLIPTPREAKLGILLGLALLLIGATLGLVPCWPSNL